MNRSLNDYKFNLIEKKVFDLPPQLVLVFVISFMFFAFQNFMDNLLEKQFFIEKHYGNR